MELDLEDFDVETGANAGFELQLNDRRGAPTAQYITVQGMDSDAYRAASLTQQRRWLKSIGRKGNVTRTPEEIEADNIEMLAAVSIGWRGFKLKDGTPAEFTREAVAAVYRKRRIIRDQVDAAIAERANFLPASSSS